jgi:hypothetical protein
LVDMSEGKMKRMFVTVVLATTAAVLGAIAISQAASTPVRVARPVHTSAHHARAQFSVLRSAKVAASSSETALPALTEKRLTEPETLVSELELEPARAVYVQIDSSTHGWVIPGRRGICLAVATSISIVRDCGTLASADTGGLIMTRQTGSGPLIYGLVPDGASVTVNNGDGSTRSITVASNVFEYGDPMAQSVSVQPAGGGVKTTPVG